MKHYTDKLFEKDNKQAFIENVDGTEYRYSTSEFKKKVGSIGAGFEHLKLNAGDSLLVLGKTDIKTLAIIVSALRYGIKVIPLNDNFDKLALQNILTNNAIQACYIGTELRKQTLEIICEHVELIVSGNESSISNFENVTSIDELLNLPVRVDVDAGNDSDIALVAYSSGSTGLPKGIEKTGKDLRLMLDYQDFHFRQFPDDQELNFKSPFICALSLGHLGGVSLGLQGLMMGRSMCLIEKFDPIIFLDMINILMPKQIILTPTMYSALFKVIDIFNIKVADLKYCFSIGEHCPSDLPDRINEYFKANLYSNYGMSECFPGIGHCVEDVLNAYHKPGCCGKYLYGEVRLVDGEGLESDFSGELWVRNETVRECYQTADLNEAKYDNGWYKTGDMFERDIDGYFYHKGRVDDVIIFNGKNIYPGEIEKVFRDHPDVENICVLAVVDKGGAECPAAYIKSNVSITDRELTKFYLERAASCTKPMAYAVRAELPILNSGKLDRTKIKETLQNVYVNKFINKAA